MPQITRRPRCILRNFIKFFSTDLSIYGERIFHSLPSLQWFLTPFLSNPRQSLTLRDIPPNSLNYWSPLTEKGDTSPLLNIVKRQILTCFVGKMFVCKNCAKFTNVARMTNAVPGHNQLWGGQSLNVSDESCWEENIKIIVTRKTVRAGVNVLKFNPFRTGLFERI